VPAIEDKLVQLAVAKILGAIYEQDFLRSSFGYRPGIGPQDAVRKLTIKLQFGRYNYVVEADIKGFFDNIDHEWMIRMLSERIEDTAILRLIKKWLKAGVLDTDGQVIHAETGTPQGGISARRSA
jgi:retron-type reverse transcriptase